MEIMEQTESKLIAVPAYNEEKNIGNLIMSIKKLYDNIDLLVIDDGSQDNTAEICREFDITLVTHIKNLGYGAAISTGIFFAYENGYGYVVFIDADGQHDVKCIEDLFRNLQNRCADYISGSRFLNKGSLYKMPFFRRIGKNIFSMVIQVFTGLRLTDPTSGFIGLNRTAMRRVVSFNDFPYDYPDANLVIYLHNRHITIREISVQMFENRQGTSMHSGLRPLYYAVKVFYSCLIYGIRGKRLT